MTFTAYSVGSFMIAVFLALEVMAHPPIVRRKHPNPERVKQLYRERMAREPAAS